MIKKNEIVWEMGSDQLKTYINNGPVVIGGIGGSGTRVVAEILQASGFYLGNDLNKSLDNLWFTLLLKEPKLLNDRRDDKGKIFLGLSILEKAMNNNRSLSVQEYVFLISKIIKTMFCGIGYNNANRGLWPLKRGLSLLNNNIISGFSGWGWKEPNSHLFIEYLSEYFQKIKYIHVVRHGLDMAFSNNQIQLYNWGSLFNIERKNITKALPAASIDYWIKANKKAIQLGGVLLKDRFLLINFDSLCDAPECEIKKIIAFLKLRQIDDEKFRQLCLIPKKPVSSGRYKDHDLRLFSEYQLEEVKRMGFRI